MPFNQYSLQIAATETVILHSKRGKVSAHYLPFTKFKPCFVIAAMSKCNMVFFNDVSFLLRAGP